jgi:UDP-N-acetylglucosamine 4,6-dehydratase
MSYIGGHMKYLITGSGTFANAMINRLLSNGEKDITIFSSGELLQYQTKKKYPSISYVIGNIRDYEAVRKATIGMDVVFHSAAMKHIDKCEQNPEECMKTNINGSVNVINACIENNVKKLVVLSTDKATNPSTIYGCSKLFMEMYAQAVDNKNTDIIITRYGNVLGSNGSVLDIWKTQRDKGESLTVTNPETTRFFMTIDQAIDLVLYALENGKHRDLFVYNNKSCTIKQLADCISDKQTVTGYRCIEKTDEALLTINELNHSELSGNYYRVSKDIKSKTEYDKPFTSDNAERFEQKELQQLLERC